ncbi:hypothetical protein KAR91_35345, partial [Candidatus Pacearchaeota archaeon]|nr:hypothetical protein [Candidatus Pacearchaeota archaeon]
MAAIYVCFVYITLTTGITYKLSAVSIIFIPSLFLLLCFCSFSFALYVFIFFIPLQFKGIDIGYGIFSVTDVMIIELGSVWVINKILSDTSIRISQNSHFIFLLLVFIALSIINSADTQNSIKHLFRLLSSILVFFMIYDHTKSVDRLNVLLRVLVMTMLLVSLYGIYEFFILNADLPLLIDGQLNNFKRVETFFNQPNETASFIVVVMPFAIFFCKKEKAVVLKLFYIVVLVLSLLCLTLTFSRAGWLCFMLAFLFLPFSRFFKTFLVILIS